MSQFALQHLRGRRKIQKNLVSSNRTNLFRHPLQGVLSLTYISDLLPRLGHPLTHYHAHRCHAYFNCNNSG